MHGHQSHICVRACVWLSLYLPVSRVYFLLCLSLSPLTYVYLSLDPALTVSASQCVCLSMYLLLMVAHRSHIQEVQRARARETVLKSSHTIRGNRCLGECLKCSTWIGVFTTLSKSVSPLPLSSLGGQLFLLCLLLCSLLVYSSVYSVFFSAYSALFSAYSGFSRLVHLR